MSVTIKKIEQINLYQQKLAQQSNFFDKLIFINKNWPNDSRIGCKSLSSSVDFVETNLNLEEDLKEFERAFEKDEVVQL
jgi:hypothetical protein